MDARTELQECIKNMTEEAVLKLFEAAEKMMLAEEGGIDSCPYCGNKAIIGYGKRCSKQRYYFKHCLKTFVTTTHTIMSESHQSAAIGNDVITDTVQGHSIDFTKERLNLSHAYVFDMRVGKINCVNGNIA